MPACEGRLVRAHLIRQQVLRRVGFTDLWDERLWVPACGGPTGCGGHHGLFDVSRRLRLPREAIPRELDALAESIGLGWWLDREYGRLAA